MARTFVTVAALAALSAVVLSAPASAQRRIPPASSTIEQRYGVSTYDGTFLHPAGRRNTAVPVYLEDGRTGELMVASDRRDLHALYFRDDETGEIYPVRLDARARPGDVIREPRVIGIERHRHDGRAAWEQDALIIGGSAAAGALIGAAAGGAKGAGVGAAVGGIGGLIVDLLSQDNRAPRPPRRR